MSYVSRIGRGVLYRQCYLGSSKVLSGGLVTKSCMTLVTPGTVAHQAPQSMGFSRQEY